MLSCIVRRSAARLSLQRSVALSPLALHQPLRSAQSLFLLHRRTTTTGNDDPLNNNKKPQPAPILKPNEAESFASILGKDFVDPDSVFKLPRALMRAVAIMACSQFIVNAAFGVVIPVLPQFASEIGLGPMGVGAIISAPSAVRVLINFKMGVWADTYGRRPLMIFGTLASAAAGFGTAFATSFGTMIPFRVLAGIGSSASMVGTNAFMSDVTSVARNHRAKLLGFQQTISGLAFVAGPALGGIMAEAYGARTAFYVVGVSAALCSFGYSFLPETVTNPRQIALFKRRTGGSAPQTAVEQPPIVPTAAATPTISTVVDNPKVLPPVTTPDTPPASPPEEPAAATTTTATVGDLDAAATAKPAEMTWRQLLSDPTQQSLLVVVAAMCVCYSAQIAVLPLHLASVFHMSVGDIGLVFSIASGLSVCGAAVGGWAADRFGRKVVIVSSSMLAAVSACLLTLPATPVHFTFVMVVWSLALSLLNPALSALAADIAPNAHRGKTMALSRQASDVMFAIGPIALGALSQAVNSQAALVTTGALVAAAALHFVVRAKPPSLHTRISAKPTKAQVDKDDTKDS